MDDVDLVVLNGANAVLRFETVSEHPLHRRNAARRAEFVSLAAREAEDELARVQRSLERWWG